MKQSCTLKGLYETSKPTLRTVVATRQKWDTRAPTKWQTSATRSRNTSRRLPALQLPPTKRRQMAEWADNVSKESKTKDAQLLAMTAQIQALTNTVASLSTATPAMATAVVAETVAVVIVGGLAEKKTSITHTTWAATLDTRPSPSRHQPHKRGMHPKMRQPQGLHNRHKLHGRLYVLAGINKSTTLPTRSPKLQRKICPKLTGAGTGQRRYFQ